MALSLETYLPNCAAACMQAAIAPRRPAATAHPTPAPSPVRLQLVGMGATSAAVTVFWMTSRGSL